MSEIPMHKWLNFLFKSGGNPTEEKKKLLSVCTEMGNKFQSDLSTYLFSIILRNCQCGLWDFDSILVDLTDIASKSPTAEYLVIALEHEKNLKQKTPIDAAIQKRSQIERFENRHSLAKPFLFGLKAKLATEVGDYESALTELQKAYSLFPDFSFWIKHYLLTDRLLRHAPRHIFRREIRLGLIGSCTTGFLAQFLRSAALARGIRLEIYEGPFGNYSQEILNPQSGLYHFQPDAVFLLLESHDFSPEQVVSADRVHKYVNHIQRLRDLFRERSAARWIQTGLEIPSADAWGGMEYTRTDGRARRLEQLNLMMSSNLPAGVSFLHPSQLAGLHSGTWTSQRDWYVAKQYPAPEALPILADAVVAHLAAGVGLNKKVLVLDLDNTCWGGVIGEDGLDGIKIGQMCSDGESFIALQRYASELQKKGVLLAVCSKNNEQDAVLPFYRHPEMILKREDFVAFRADWNDKVTNLRLIAEELSLGLDSFVFVDDNPVERALVRQRLPDVVVPEFDNLHWKIVPMLKRGMYFETCELTAEDQKRHESYQLRAHLGRRMPMSADLEEFLGSLMMTSQSLEIDAGNLPRVTQLLNKSNQFNLTTRRYTQEEIRLMTESEHWWCRVFTLNDSYQQHGIVGVLFAERGMNCWTIDSLVMSCRVIGRNLETYMLSEVLCAAKNDGATELFGRYLPTKKNGLVRQFYSNHGFTEDEEQGWWRFDLKNDRFPECRVITTILDELSVV